MASFMSLTKKLDLSNPMIGVTGVVVDGAVGFAASYGLGQLYHRKSDKWYGKHAPKIAAAVGKVGAAVMFGVMGGPSVVGGGLNSVGQAGLNAIGLELGLRHARKSTGKKAVLVPADAKVPGSTELGHMTQMGALGKAQPGRGMSWDAIEELAAGH